MLFWALMRSGRDLLGLSDDPASSIGLRRGFLSHCERKAGEETRTLDVHLGKVVLYQLSYAREAGDHD